MACPVWTSDRSLRLPAASAEEACALAEAVRAADHPWLADAVPSSRAVLVIVDPLLGELGAIESALGGVSAAPAAERREPRDIEIPVCYDPRLAPDLDEVAGETGLSRQEIGDRHAGAVYTAECVGFSPGFAYLAGVHESLRVPRRAEPRPRVPPGSVAITGATTAVYPHATPGGWRLIGRTPLAIFDPARPEPALIRVGDRVRFRPITFVEYESRRMTAAD